MKKFLTIVLLQLVCVMLFAVSASAETADFKADDSANSWRYENGQPIADMYGTQIIADDPYHPNATLTGIDVSKHQGVIDWEKVKAAGIDFAIIRCGYGEDKTEYDDIRWEYNASECERLGIPYGVYLYSYAFNVAEAKSEADHVLRLIKGHTPSLPIYYDMEDNSTLPYDHVAMANAFCQKISNAGYPVGIYASKYWWTTYLNDPSLDKWYRWVAQWNNECTYNGRYELWQYSNKGRVNGITTDVDMNFLIGYPDDHCVVGVPKISGGVTENGTVYDGLPTLKWKAVQGAFGYRIYRSAEKNGSYTAVGDTTETTFTDTDVKPGNTYYYKVSTIGPGGVESLHSNVAEVTAMMAVVQADVKTVNISGKPKLSWNKVANACEYEIYRQEASGDYKLLTVTDSTKYTDTTATAGKVYYYKIKSVYSGDKGVKSLFSTPVYTTCRLAELSIKVKDNTAEGTIKLVWLPQKQAKNYKIYKADSWNGSYKLIKTVTATEYTVESGPQDAPYYYKVVAAGAVSGADSVYSRAVSCVYTKPVAVKTMNFELEGESDLVWQWVPKATCYEIYRKVNNDSYRLVYVTTDTHYTNASATDGKTYHYKVRAVYCPQ